MKLLELEIFEFLYTSAAHPITGVRRIRNTPGTKSTFPCKLGKVYIQYLYPKYLIRRLKLVSFRKLIVGSIGQNPHVRTINPGYSGNFPGLP